MIDIDDENKAKAYDDLLITELIKEIHSLKLTIDKLQESIISQKKVIGKTDSLKKKSNAIFKTGDKIEIINNHNGLQGKTVEIHKVTNDRVYFLYEGKITWRKKKNVKLLK